MGHRHADAFLRFVYNELAGTVVIEGLFDNQNIVLLCETRQQMLRPLEHEIPTQMREANDSVTVDKLRAWESSNTHIFEQFISLYLPSQCETCATLRLNVSS